MDELENEKQPKVSSFFQKKSILMGPVDNKNSGRRKRSTSREDGSLRISAKKVRPNSQKPAHKNHNKLTLLDEEVQQLKLRHMDKILMIQVGYKYKFYAEDAVKASSLLNFMLIEGKLNIRNNTADDLSYKNFAYCSIPDQRLKIHLKKLLHYGYKVGIVKQFLIPGSSSKFERKLTQVFTRATYSTMNEEYEEEEGGGGADDLVNEKGCILAIDVTEKENKRRFTFISIELNTGKLIYNAIDESANKKTFANLETQLKHFDPSEVCLSRTSYLLLNNFIKGCNPNVQVYCVEEIYHEKDDGLKKLGLEQCYSLLYSHLKTYFLEDTLLNYRHNLKHFFSKDTCPLSSSILKHLNFFSNQVNSSKHSKTVMSLLENGNINTAYGSSMLENWIRNPLINKDLIQERAHAISFLQENEYSSLMFFENINHFLGKFKNKNLLKTCNRIKMNVKTPVNRRELFYYLASIAELRNLFKRHSEYYCDEILTSGRLGKHSSLLREIFININDQLNENVSIDYTIKMINHSSIFEKNVELQITSFFDLNIYDNSNPIINHMKKIDEIKDEIQECLVHIRTTLGKPYLKFKDDKDFLVEINKNCCKNIPSDWIVDSNTKFVVRYEIPLVKQRLEHLKLNKLELVRICQSEYLRFLEKINQDYNAIVKILDLLATFDCLQCLAKSTKQFICTPVFTEDCGKIELTASHNPMLFSSIDTNSNLDIPNDISLCSENTFILTGPNSGGKTSLLKQVAYLSILAQIGCKTPCATHVQSVFTNFFIRTGSSDSLLSNKSTFLMEMEECQQILLYSGNRSLILMDEIGKGTSNLDGMAITYAILKHLQEAQGNHGIVMFITHYHKIVQEFPQRNVYQMGFDKVYKSLDTNDEIVFKYKLESGACSESLGINVAKLAGLSEDVLSKIVENKRLIEENDEVQEFYTCLKMQSFEMLRSILNKS